METRPTLGILFFLRKERVKKNEECPIYLRITVDGKRVEHSIKRTIKKARWNKEAGYGKGNKEDIRELNEYIDTLRTRVRRAQKELIENHEQVTAIALKAKLTDTYKKQRSILEVFKYHNKLIAEDNDHSPATIIRYQTTLKHTSDFIKHEYKTEDLFLNQLNYEFVSGFDHYLRTTKGCGNNTTVKYIKNLKKIINLALKNEWIDKDPFLKYQVKLKEVKREFLSEEELKDLEDKEITVPRLNLVRDIFIFSCYTGLAYIDIAQLTPDNIRTGIDSEKWIYVYRHKTKSKSNIPLLPKALELIDKYKEHPVALNRGKLFPVFSNQKLNAYLKEIADLVGSKKNLTFHKARHTFATTVTLANDVPIETVSEMLGHKSIKTTQIYAKVIEKKVSSDMKSLKEKLTMENKNNSSAITSD